MVSNSTYSQRIRVINGDTLVTFTRNQAKAINDTFFVQRQTIKELSNKPPDTIKIKEVIKQEATVTRDGWIFLTAQIVILIIVILV